MLEPEVKQLVRTLWQKFWEAQFTDTLRVVEQVSYLIFMKRIEVLDDKHVEQAETLGEKYSSIFKGKDAEGDERKTFRWSSWKNMNGLDMLEHVRDKVFPFIKNLHGDEDTLFAQTMKDASFQIETGKLLQEAVSIIDKLDLSHHRPDAQGDIFEELLSELQQSGKNGQFRTPRHIVNLMVEMINPTIGETICDPACGTGGFLIGAYEHIVRNKTSPNQIKYTENGEAYGFVGDKITSQQWDLLRTRTFYGIDGDRTMLRIGTFNMILHGIRYPNISRLDSLSKRFDQSKKFHIVMANPPFSGTIDASEINENFSTSTKKTELLFIELFYNILENGGRGAVIVPSGVLFGTSNTHLAIKKLLLEKCQLDAIIYFPSGVFKPYAGVSTAILFFTKGGKTNKVWLYDVETDGYSLDDKREKIDKDDLPDILAKFPNKEQSDKSITITIEDIKENNYDLSVKKYIDNSEPEEKINIQKVIDKLQDLKKERQELENKVTLDLKEIGYKV
ncbi:Type I restriction-modification system specificity subunit [metagenome]